MFNYLKILFAIAAFSVFIELTAQTIVEPEVLNFTAICDENDLFENHHRINNRIISKDFNSGIYSLAIDLYGNCSISDSSWISISNDTLQIWTGPTDTIIGNWRILIAGSEGDCYFHLKYDIDKLSKEPNTILFNGTELNESRDKFLPEQYITLQGRKYLQYDSNGVAYYYNFYDSGILKRIRKESGLLTQVWLYSESGKLFEIFTDNRAIPGGKLYKKEINTVANKPL